MDRRRLAIISGLAIFALLDGLVFGIFSALWSQAYASPEAPADSDEVVWLISADYANDGDLSNAVRRLHTIQSDDVLATRLVREAAYRASFKPYLFRTEPLLQLANALSAENVAVEANPGSAQAAAIDSGNSDDAARSVQVAAQPTVRHGIAFLAPAQAAATSAPAAKNQVSQPATKPSTASNTNLRSRSALASAAQPLPTTAVVAAKTNPKATAAAARPALALSANSSQATTGNPAIAAPPGVNFAVASVRRLTACENGGNHHLFIRVEDTAGNGLGGLPVEVVWPSGQTIVTTGQKVENLPDLGVTAQNTAGYVNFAMYHGSYKVRVLNGVSQQTDWLTVDIPASEYCARNDNPQGNSLFHYSYLIVFKKVR